MKTKIFSLLSLSILMTVFLVSAVSAATTYIETFENFTQGGTYGDNSFTGVNNIIWSYEDARNEYSPYEIDNEGMIFQDTDGRIYSNTISGGISNFSVKLSDGDSVTENRQVELYINGVSQGTSTVFDDDTTHIFTVNNINIEGNIVIEIKNVLGSYIIIDDITWTTYTAEPLACAYDEGNLRVDIDNVDLINGFGDDDEWWPFDEIDVDIEVSNNNDDEKIKDIEIKWGLWSEETNEWVIELDDHDVDEIDLKKDDEEIVTFKFKLNKKQLDVDLDDLEEGDYTLYVIANGEEQVDPKKDVCSMDSEAVKIIIEDDFVILNNFEINGIELEDDYLLSDPVSCGGKLQITADVWNLGDEQDDVYVMVHDVELGINKKVEIGDINDFDNEKLTFEFELPKDLEEGWHNLWFTVYDDNNDVYENGDDDKSEYSLSLKVEGNCNIGPQVMLDAQVESGGKAGKELVIKATVTNTGDELTNYVLNAEGYTDWASLEKGVPSTVILNAGESKEVLITFKINKDVSGEKSFKLNVVSDGEPVEKIVSVSIEKSGFSLSGLTGNVISEGNWYLWGIGALNVLLVIIIILVAVRVARK